MTEDKPRFRAILHNTILLLVPSLNPDGVDIVTRWYRRTLGTAYRRHVAAGAVSQVRGARQQSRLVHVLAAGNAADGLANCTTSGIRRSSTTCTSRAQYASRIFVPPWLDPIEPNVDAILAQEMNMIGTAMAADLTAAGKKGVAIHAAYDFWTPARHYQAFHGGLRILTESASAQAGLAR